MKNLEQIQKIFQNQTASICGNSIVTYENAGVYRGTNSYSAIC
jgi:hypothetical protein